jgi:uncharacterized protein YaaQ
MFNSQFGQALFEILPGEVSSFSSLIKILGVLKRGKITFLIIVMDSSVEALRHGIASTHLDT